ncbi:DsbA family protein [Adhaeribacter soli]|uniref:DsbA family protein n=1 Tax=Adhaeribacter soli TaxID=2607655 RepID=A0A5N1INZ5_9BACT|nr:DsbA family protein [Adhaeribacter soli]KAA9325491.1 DsbA family protein [Adhaeribacter soli]
MQKPVFYYVYDGLCGWCFGFAPVVAKVQAAFHDKLSFEVLSGGMITGTRVGPIKEMAGYIKNAVPRLKQVTGITFGDAYLNEVLENGTYISNSLPPAIALAIFKEQFPDRQVHFAHSIQNLHFLEGKDLNNVNVYLPLAEAAGISEADFRAKFNDVKYREAAEKEFQLVQNWGIDGFPAVVIEKDEQLYLLSQGYQSYEDLTSTLNQLLEGKIGQKENS